MNQQQEIPTTTDNRVPRTDAMEVRKWKSEIHEFLADVRQEIDDALNVGEDCTSRDVEETKDVAPPKRAADEDRSGESALDRLEMLKRQLDERCQNRRSLCEEDDSSDRT